MRRFNEYTTSLKKVSKYLPSYLLNPFERIKNLESTLVNTFTSNTLFLPSFYRTNENIWLEGLLIDFLQKIIFDKWVRRFLVHSSYLVSERVLFDFVVRFYIDYVIWPAHFYSIFDYRIKSKYMI